MSNGWFLVHNEQQWSEYKAKVSAQVSEGAVQWGEAPKEFPCLVTSYSPTPGKVVSCYVFVAEAIKLVEAHGLPVSELAVRAQAVNTVGPAQGEFNRSIWAHIRTLIKILRDTGVIKDDDYYERIYAAELNSVDQDEADSKKSLLDGIEGEAP
jgi:hypothetical protein